MKAESKWYPPPKEPLNVPRRPNGVCRYGIRRWYRDLEYLTVCRAVAFPNPRFLVLLMIGKKTKGIDFLAPLLPRRFPFATAFPHGTYLLFSLSQQIPARASPPPLDFLTLLYLLRLAMSTPLKCVYRVF